MKHFFKENIQGGSSPDTTIEIFSVGNKLNFVWTCRNSALYCPYQKDNENLYEGCVCEVFLSPKAFRGFYWEFEVAPNNALFSAKIHYTPQGRQIEFCDAHAVSRVELFDGGYQVSLTVEETFLGFELSSARFNAFRIECSQTSPRQRLFALNPTMCPTFHVKDAFMPISLYVV